MERPSEFKWIPITDRLPDKDNRYLVHAPSGDPDKPLVSIAWFHPDEKAWSLIPPMWAEAITHWAEVPPPPSPPTPPPGS